MSTIEVTRKTVRQSVTLSGRGLHGGQSVTVTIHPGESGIAFRAGSDRWEATPENVTDTTRSTRLGAVSTVEHLMSALAGLEVTDAEIEVEGGEMPGLDGSSREYVDAIQAQGLADIGVTLISPPFKRVYLQEEGISLAAAKGEGHWRFEYVTGERWPGSQVFEALDAVAAYRADIAPARTFALLEELPFIEKAGLAKGLDETSAVILGNSGYENAARFEDEPARHKLLDAMGDLYLSGIPVRLLNVVAVRSGHRTNVAFAKLLKEAMAKEKAMGAKE